MNSSYLIQAFDRGKDLVRQATSTDEVVDIIQQLENITLDYLGDIRTSGPNKPSPPVLVGELTKWG